MASPPASHLIYGKVYSPKGRPVGATITLTLESESIYTTVNSSGEYSINAADLPSGWSEGDTVSITATLAKFGTVTESLVLTDSPQNQDLVMTISGDLSFYDADIGDRLVIRGAIITDYDGNPLTLENPLAVQNELRPVTRKMALLSSGQIEYLGEAAPGTLTSSSRWRIRKFEYDDGNTKPATGELWANGNAEYDKVWDDRTTYDFA